ncbi:hypothetical protein BDF22DRAFT_658496 [Syncephalis plumigaleata]|nr:hypothetical protein BDF22DRAFT_658496 [Syncephalis plumigaleata]
MSNYYQNVQKHEKEHEEETRQPIVNATTSVSSNSPGISIIIIIIDTSQHTNHEAEEEHWIDYIYKDTAMTYRGYDEYLLSEREKEIRKEEKLKEANQRLDLFGAMAFMKKQDHKDELQDKDIIK